MRQSSPRTARATSSAARIYDSALRLFSERGYHASGIREIAGLAGVNTSVLYHYARSKDDLLSQLLADGTARYRAAALRCVAEGERPEERLVALVSTQVMANGRHRRMARVLDHEQSALPRRLRKDVLRMTAEVEQLWDETIAAGAEEGVFAVESPRMARLALLRMAAGVNQWYAERGALSIEEIARIFSDLALGLVRARRGGRLLRVGDLKRPDVRRLAAIIEEELGPPNI